MGNEVEGPGSTRSGGRIEATAMAGSSDDPDTLEIYDSRPLFAAYFAGMAMAAVRCALLPGWGPILAIAFGSHALWSLRRLLHRRPRISVSEEGIRDEKFWYSPGLIPWDEVRDVRRTRFGLVELELRDEGAFWNRLSPLRQLPRVKTTLLGFGPALVTPWGLEGSTRRVVSVIQEGLERHLLESVRSEHVLPLEGDGP
jgi:hypothetical protein